MLYFFFNIRTEAENVMPVKSFFLPTPHTVAFITDRSMVVVLVLVVCRCGCELRVFFFFFFFFFVCFSSRKHAFIILTLLNPTFNSKAGGYRGIIIFFLFY